MFPGIQDFIFLCESVCTDSQRKGMYSIIEGANETDGDSLMVTDEIIEVEVNKKGTLLELQDDIS